MDGYRLQLILFDLIKERVKNPKLWIDEISEQLSLSKSAVYKKVNASSSLSIEELSNLLVTYDISFDQLIRPDIPTVAFSFPYMKRDVNSFFDYLAPIKTSLEQLSHLPNASVEYATNELPIFYWLLNRNVGYFKLFNFAQTVWGMEGYKDRKFSLKEFSGESLVLKEGSEICKMYFDLPTTEFWNEHILSNTLNQVKYMANSGVFEDINDALILLDGLDEIMRHCMEMAATGKKHLPGTEVSEANANFALYHNEITHTSNTIMVDSDSRGMVFTVYDNPNFMTSQDLAFVEYTRAWFRKLRTHSMPISLDSKKSRMHLFTQIMRRIEMTRGEIQTIIDTGSIYG